MGKAIKSVANVNPLTTVVTGGKGGPLGAAMKKLGLGLEDEQGDYAKTGDVQDFYRNYDREMGLADKGVQNSALTRDVYGEGGLQGQLAKEQSQLANQGFQLTQDDRTAYGQAAGDIARQFGQQEQDLTSSLARRGLAGAASGAAGAAFSGLAGNKNEMLAKAQMDIAQKRYQDTQNRLQNVRNQMQSLAGQGSQLSRQRYSDKGAGLAAASDAQSKELANKQAALKPGLLSTIGQGLQAGIGTAAVQAPGALVTGGASLAAPSMSLPSLGQNKAAQGGVGGVQQNGLQNKQYLQA